MVYLVFLCMTFVLVRVVYFIIQIFMEKKIMILDKSRNYKLFLCKKPMIPLCSILSALPRSHVTLYIDNSTSCQFCWRVSIDMWKKRENFCSLVFCRDTSNFVVHKSYGSCFIGLSVEMTYPVSCRKIVYTKVFLWVLL